MEFKNLLLQIDGHLAIVTINRPEALNALNRETLTELDVLFSKVLLESPIKAVLITGAGKAFVAGADIKEMAEMTPEEARRFALLGQSAFAQIERFHCPVIAVVNGYALGGGCELAMSCDIRLASEKARLGQPEVSLGVTPGFGGAQRLMRLVGAGKAKELLFTGNMVSADEALKIGLVNAVYPPEELMNKAKEMAQKIIGSGPVSVAYCKQAVNWGGDVALERALNMEADLFALSFATEDQKEGMKAFIEKRAANFKGK